MQTCHLLDPEFAKLPIVAIDRPIKGRHLDCVVVENQAGADFAVQHLIAHGHKRIAYLGLSSQLYTIRARYKGYRDAMSRVGLSQDVHYGNPTQPEMLLTMQALLNAKDAPTALFCSNNLITRHTLHALYELKVPVPEKIALIGFDDFETADLIRPGITVVRQPTAEMGRTGAHVLFTRMRKEDKSAPGNRVVLPVELIVRESCGLTH